MQSKEQLEIRLYGSADWPTLIYCPGIHGDWTLVSSFRAALQGRVRFVEFTYPRTLEWSLEDYGTQAVSALLKHGVKQGWLLGESFGSQVVWAMLHQSQHPLSIDGMPSVRARATSAPPNVLQVQGVILAGGFVRHPAIWGVRLARQIWNHTPLWCLYAFLHLYKRCARFRHRHAPETLAGLGDFVVRRNALDQQAMGHRFTLIAAHDPRRLACALQIPIFYLSGGIDPIVPWPWVYRWLKRNCPTFRGARIIWSADHAVLATAPRAAAEQVLQWMFGNQPAPNRA